MTGQEAGESFKAITNKFLMEAGSLRPGFFCALLIKKTVNFHPKPEIFSG